MKREIIYHANGENSGTYGPLCFKENFTGDINEKTEKFVSWDCNIYQTVAKYKTCTFDMPAWMDEQTFLSNHIQLTFLIGLSGINPDEIQQPHFYKLIGLGEKWQYFLGWIKTKKGSFMESIQQQIETWLNDPQPKYPLPLSQKQFEAASKFCPLYNAKSISNDIARYIR